MVSVLVTVTAGPHGVRRQLPCRPRAAPAADGRWSGCSSSPPGAGRPSGPGRPAAPVRLAQSTASPRLTSGSAGFSGGFLPAAAFQDRSRSLRVSAAAPRPATNEKTVHTLELSDAMARRYPAGFVCAPPVRRRSQTADESARARTALASSSGCREHTSQYGAGSAGSSDLHPDRALEVGAQQQVRAGVRLRPGDPAGLLGVQGRDGAEVSRLDPGPAGPEPPGVDAHPGAAVADEKRREQRQRDPAADPGGRSGQRHDQGQPQARDQHHALHPPPQRDAQPLVVRGRVHAADPPTRRSRGLASGGWSSRCPSSASTPTSRCRRTPIPAMRGPTW